MNRHFGITLLNLLRALTAPLLFTFCTQVAAHGGVMIEDDLCIIKFGFYKAHFTIYQPETSRDKEFCEDLPDPARTMFVMAYLHDSLAVVPVDFRIIRDVTGLGRYAKWRDLEGFESLDEFSVFYQPPIVRPEGFLRIEHDFEEEGDYIGIVTARHPSGDKIYRAVFPFQVGNRRLAYLFALAIAAGLALLEVRFRTFTWLIRKIKKNRYGSP